MFKSIKTRILVILGLMLFTGAVLTTKALAANGNANPPGQGDCKPGWGWGSDDSCHALPPGGPSTHPVFP